MKTPAQNSKRGAGFARIAATLLAVAVMSYATVGTAKDAGKDAGKSGTTTAPGTTNTASGTMTPKGIERVKDVRAGRPAEAKDQRCTPHHCDHSHQH